MFIICLQKRGQEVTEYYKKESQLKVFIDTFFWDTLHMFISVRNMNMK